MEPSELKNVKEFLLDFFQKTTIPVQTIDVDSSSNVISVNIILREPEILIGQNGQTLFELQRLLKIILNKKLFHNAGDSIGKQKNQGTARNIFSKILGGVWHNPQQVDGAGFYLELDINNYKKKKIEYLKRLAVNMANEVAFTKEKKILSPMPAHERRVIHTELAQRQDVVTESQGEGEDRHLVIGPR